MAGGALLLGTGLAFTQGSGATSAAVQGGGLPGSGSFAQATPLSGTATCGGQAGVYAISGTDQGPAWAAQAGMAGTPGGGDLYCVQVAAGDQARLVVTVVNTGNLAADYTSINLPIGVWSLAGTAWQTPAGALLDQYASLIDPTAMFTLWGGSAGATYEVALDGPAAAVATPPAVGGFFCEATVASGLSPSFYVQVLQGGGAA